jgi:hypothetical protein
LVSSEADGVVNPSCCFISVRKCHAFRYDYITQLKWNLESWETSLHKLAYKLACLRSELNVFTGFHNQNKWDLFSQFEFSQLHYTTQFGPQLNQHHPDFNGLQLSGYQLLHKIRFNYLELEYSKIFFMSFNSYFSDPVLNYNLGELSSLGSIQFYTFMFSYTPVINFNSQNMLPTELNLVSLFSGKHAWSKYICSSTSLVIIDNLFIRTLPAYLVYLLNQFCIRNSNRICVVNSNSSNLLQGYDIYTSFFTHTGQQFFQPVSLESTQFLSKISLAVPDYNLVPFFSTGQDYVYTLNPIRLQFSQFPKSFYSVPRLDLGFRFPISPFVSITTNYKFPFDPSVYWADRILKSSYRAIGQVFRSVTLRLTNIRRYLHHWEVVYVLVFFVYFIVLCSQKIGVRVLDSIFFSLGLHFSDNYLVSNYIAPFKWDSFGKFRFEYFLIGADKNQSHKCYLKFADRTRFIQYYYSSFDFVSINDPFVTFSKTLSMERMFRVSRFMNFV